MREELVALKKYLAKKKVYKDIIGIDELPMFEGYCIYDARSEIEVFYYERGQKMNNKSFQDNTYSCGFYSMHFMEHMLQGLPFHKYLKSGLSDKKMKEYISHCYLDPQEIKC